jgi:hypothetical protein
VDLAAAVAGVWQGVGPGRILFTRLTASTAASGLSQPAADTLDGKASVMHWPADAALLPTPGPEDRGLPRLVNDFSESRGARSQRGPAVIAAGNTALEGSRFHEED